MDTRTDSPIDPTPLPNNSHLMLAELCGTDQRVLELGCGTGIVTEKLAAQGCTVWAVDIDPAGVDLAAAHADRAMVADLDTADLTAMMGDTRFDRIVLGDVIEHLREPERLLVQLLGLVADGGCLIGSVPNVAHADLRLLLLQGSWPYQPLGLLDRTHVRFYTPDTFRELLEQTGWAIDRDERVVLGVFGTELAQFLDPALIPDGLAAVLGQDRSATTYQTVLVAVPRAPGDAAGHAGSTGGTGPATTSVPTETTAADIDPVVALLGENEHLRARVAELSDVIEELHWANAQRPPTGVRAVIARLPEPAQRRLRTVAGRLRR